MAISTKKIPQGGGIPKTIQPGNTNAKINNVALEVYPYKTGALHVVLSLETPKPSEDYEGFYINKDKPALGRHEGQVGKVKAGEYAFSDGTTKGGVQISRDNEILKFLNQLCGALGIADWYREQDEKHDTIESLINAFNTDKPYEGIYLNWCIAGKEYKNKAGYTNYDLFLPKFSSKDGVPYESEAPTTSKLLKYDPALHIKKKKPEEVVNTFGAEEGTATRSSFNLD
jgi:hypothetical protein